jgi:hypothetical protein
VTLGLVLAQLNLNLYLDLDIEQIIRRYRISNLCAPVYKYDTKSERDTYREREIYIQRAREIYTESERDIYRERERYIQRAREIYTESERDIYEYCASDCSLEVVKVAHYLQNHVSNMWEILCIFYIVK